MDTRNEFQLGALKLSEGKEGSCHEMLDGKDWFNSESHLAAFEYLILEKKISVSVAMKELDNLTSAEADGIAMGFSREDALGLNPYMVVVIDSFLRSRLVEPKHFKGRDWFNTASHASALSTLIRQANRTFNEAMLNHLEGKNFYFLALIARGYAVEDLNQLQSIQIELLSKNIALDNLEIDKSKVIKLIDWIETEEQCELFALLEKKAHGFTRGNLKLTKKATNSDSVKEWIADLKKPSIVSNLGGNFLNIEAQQSQSWISFFKERVVSAASNVSSYLPNKTPTPIEPSQEIEVIAHPMVSVDTHSEKSFLASEKRYTPALFTENEKENESVGAITTNDYARVTSAIKS